MTQATVSFGDYEVLAQTSSSLDYRLIAFGLEPEVQSILSQTMTTISKYYLGYYPLPSASRYVQFVYPAKYMGGEAYPTSSVSAVVSEKIKEGQWKLTLAHELFHVWNPFLIPGAETEEMEWFKEGFTNYLSERALLETSEIEEATWKSHVLAHYSNYLEGLEAAPETVTVATSGTDKDEYGALVYDGGRAIAAWLDRELIRTSGGETDLRALIVKLINTANTGKTILNVKSFLEAVAVTDSDISEDLKTYLVTKTPVPNVIDPES